MDAREVMLVGSVPIKPASGVFDAICRRGLAPLMKRVPDGEQAGWDATLFQLDKVPAFELSCKKRMTLRPSTFFEKLEVPYVRLRPGKSASDVEIVSLGIAENAAQSYAEFKRFKAAGHFGPETRFCVTLAGPGTVFAPVEMPPADLFPVAERVFKTEIQRVLAAVPAEQLAIQLDLAVEVELEEFRRRPGSFQMPVFENMDWELDEVTAMVANVANSIPDSVELGFHLCAIYHVDESQGQDLNVHVDFANALSRKIERPIGYIHIPTVPTHDENDFRALQRLVLHPETTLFIGLVHAEDGIEGARQRINAAAKCYPEFGIAAFCGLKQPSRAEYLHPHSVDEVLDMHRGAADGVT